MSLLIDLSALNQKHTIADIKVETLDQYELTADQRVFFEEYRPENKLIIYGTLAPGKPNHHKISHIQGEWKSAILKGGKLESKGWGADLGFNGFVSTPENEQIDISCYVLFSDDLSYHWHSLDEFEGDGYRRILAEYELENGLKGFGYIYGINQ